MTAKKPTAAQIKASQPRRKNYNHQSHLAAVRNVILYLDACLPKDATPLEKFYFRLAKKDEDKFGARVMALEREWMRSPRKKQAGKGKPFGQERAPDPGTEKAKDILAEWFAKQEKLGYARPTVESGDGTPVSK